MRSCGKLLIIVHLITVWNEVLLCECELQSVVMSHISGAYLLFYTRKSLDLKELFLSFVFLRYRITTEDTEAHGHILIYTCVLFRDPHHSVSDEGLWYCLCNWQLLTVLMYSQKKTTSHCTKRIPLELSLGIIKAWCQDVLLSPPCTNSNTFLSSVTLTLITSE